MSNSTHRTYDLFSEEKLIKHLEKHGFSGKLYFFKELDSTNNFARDMAEKGEPHLTLIVAEKQYSGRGRLNREWFSPPGGLWLSLLLKPAVPVKSAHHFTFITGVAVAHAINKVTSLKISLKWPNDLLLNEKKLGGILTEAKTDREKLKYLILGMGINVNIEHELFPEELKEEATSLFIETTQIVERAELLGVFIEEWQKEETRYLNKGFEAILKDWRQFASILGQKIRVETSKEVLEGIVTDISPSGGLMLKTTTEKTIEIISGDVKKIKQT